MDRKNVIKSKNVYILGGIAFFLVLFAVCAFFFLCSTSKSQGTTAYVFDGWYFGREDQKKVGSVLGAAGLNDYTWESGKLSVPISQKNEYQSALAVAGAYPTAPSETRLEALRESNVFESDSKLRMRELNACATQLERTIEQMRGVEYATVGYRSRREQSGLVAKNVVTASIGVALQEDATLDANFLVAVTLAAKHQLGIDESHDVSILDLKAGKSYLGVDGERGAETNDAAVLEKERVENYWRDKYLEAFGDIEGVRVSVVADLTDAEDAAKNAEKTSDARRETNRGVGEIRTVAYTKPIDNQSVEVRLQDGRRVDVANSLTKEDDDSGFARLGNPTKKNARANASNQIRPLATSDEREVGADSPTPCLPLNGEGLGRRLEDAVVLASRSTREVEDERTAPNRIEDADGVYSARSRRESNVVGGVAQASYLEKLGSDSERRSSSAEFVLRSIIVRIAVPKSYVRRVFQRIVAEKNKEKTFAEESDDEREALYRDTETKIIEETKKFAVALFRPTGERLGWKDDALENSFYVDVFSDATTTNASDAANFVSKYASFDILETAPKSKEPSEKEQSGAEKVAESSEELKDVSKTEANDAGTGATNPEGGVLADTLEKISELVATEESNGTDETAAFGELVKTLFDRCVKASKSPQTFIAALIDAVAALIFYFFLKYKKALKRKKKGVSSSAKKAKVDAESSKIPNRETTTQKIDDEDDVFDDELERELLNIASTGASKSDADAPKTRKDSNSSNERDFWEQRRTALDLIAKYPERAAASLQNWVKNPS